MTKAGATIDGKAREPAYWFASYSGYPEEIGRKDLYRQIVSFFRGGHLIPRPVTRSGWLLLIAGMATMVVGAVIAVLLGTTAYLREVWGLVLGAWILSCIAGFGFAIERKRDHTKTAEMYMAEASSVRRLDQ